MCIHSDQLSFQRTLYTSNTVLFLANTQKELSVSHLLSGVRWTATVSLSAQISSLAWRGRKDKVTIRTCDDYHIWASSEGDVSSLFTTNIVLTEYCRRMVTSAPWLLVKSTLSQTVQKSWLWQDFLWLKINLQSSMTEWRQRVRYSAVKGVNYTRISQQSVFTI